MRDECLQVYLEKVNIFGDIKILQHFRVEFADNADIIAIHSDSSLFNGVQAAVQARPEFGGYINHA